jgi:hypothetical protein
VQQANLLEKKNTAKRMADSIDMRYRSEMESFNSWVTTRNTTRSSMQDEEVLARTKPWTIPEKPRTNGPRSCSRPKP